MTEPKEPVKKRSKAFKVILLVLAAAYFWASRHQVWLDGDRIVRYNKWTGHSDTIKLLP